MLDDLRLVDHHVHGVTRAELSRSQWEAMLTESNRPIPASTTVFDSQVGLAVRRWCAPILGLPSGATPQAYWARRVELGAIEVNRRLLGASGVDTYLVDTGYGESAESLRPARVEEILRIETLMEQVGPTDFPDAFREALRSTDAVALKSILAYRHGFDIDPTRPTDAEVMRARRDNPGRITDPVLLRFGLWSAVDLGLPLQIHTGYGDPDLDLHRCDPLLLTAWLRVIDSPVVLLHCYPFHRNAGYLAQVYPHVYLDVGLAVNYTGLRSEAVIAESLELAPFSKVLFSSDGCGPAELHYLGAQLWRRGMSRVLSAWVDAGECDAEDALRIATMMGRENAVRLYGLH